MEEDSSTSSVPSSISTVVMEELGGNTPDIYDCEIRLVVVLDSATNSSFKTTAEGERVGLFSAGMPSRAHLAERYQAMKSGGNGYDPRKWMQLLLPLAAENGVCIITNMDDPFGVRDEVLRLASRLGISITVGLAHQVAVVRTDLEEHLGHVDDVSVYLGASPIVECLQKFRPNVYELGWNWDDLHLLAQGSLAGHLLECGCQLTGGYYMHPGDKYRDISLQDLLHLSLPFAEVSFDGKVCVAKAESSVGVLNPDSKVTLMLKQSDYILVANPVSKADLTFAIIEESL